MEPQSSKNSHGLYGLLNSGPYAQVFGYGVLNFGPALLSLVLIRALVLKKIKRPVWRFLAIPAIVLGFGFSFVFYALGSFGNWVIFVKTLPNITLKEDVQVSTQKIVDGRYITETKTLPKGSLIKIGYNPGGFGGYSNYYTIIDSIGYAFPADFNPFS